MMRVFTHEMAKSTKRSAIRNNVERDKRIIADRESGMSFGQIAKKYGISRERCWQIWRRRDPVRERNKRMAKAGCVPVLVWVPVEKVDEIRKAAELMRVRRERRA